MTTDRQAEIKRLYDETGNQREVARILGIHRRRVWEVLETIKRRENADPAVQDAMRHVNTGIVPNGMWIKTKPTEDAPGYSVYLRPEQASPESLADAIREAMQDLPPLPAVEPPGAAPARCVVFPLADLHIGLLTDHGETGEDWDSKKAVAKFAEVFGELVACSPQAERCIIAELGDLSHVNDQTNLTQSGHQLDADTRFFVVLRRSVQAMKMAIEITRRKYPHVTYVGRRGNHNRDAHIAVTIALAERYDDVQTVRIVQNDADIHVEEYGRNMLVLHHGDRVKPDRLGHFVPAQFPEIWGRTKYRLALSGHIHHMRSQEVGGLLCESVGTFIPRDAYAVSHGYWAQRALTSITLDPDRGEVGRVRVAV
jgi:hypothetical protein